MKVLNSPLFDALTREFGSVRVADEGAAMVAQHVRVPGGRTRLIVSSAGEYYRVNCFACNDTRYRLWINHRWGVTDAKTGSRHRWAAKCFNEDCLAREENRVELIRRTSWYDRTAGAGRVKILPGKVIDPGSPKPLPEDFVRLDALKKGHPARKYVKGRGFTPDHIAELWGVGYSEDGPFPSARLGRLVIPIHRVAADGTRVWGWQARKLNEHGRSPKYFTAPDLKKSTLLYGAERVHAGNGPVAVCEGPIDVWRFGKDAVALFGKDASEFQIRLLCRIADKRPLIVALDGEAEDEAEKLVTQLRHARETSLLRPDTSPVLLLSLPAGKDPADCTTEELERFMRRLLRDA